MNPYVRGILLAGVTLAVVSVLPPERGIDLLALLLAFAAAVYVGVAEAEPDRSERHLQWLVALGFVALALLGLWKSPLALAGGWLLHAAWDWRHHRRRPLRAAPWYPPSCFAYDLVIAAFLCVWWYLGG